MANTPTNAMPANIGNRTAPAMSKAQHKHGRRDARFNGGNMNPRDAQRAADNHQAHKRRGNHPTRTSAELCRPKTHRNHRENVVEAGQRVSKTARETVRRAVKWMRSGEHGHQAHCREDNGKFQFGKGFDHFVFHRCDKKF